MRQKVQCKSTCLRTYVSKLHGSWKKHSTKKIIWIFYSHLLGLRFLDSIQSELQSLSCCQIGAFVPAGPKTWPNLLVESTSMLFRLA